MKKQEKPTVTFDEVVAGIRRAGIDPAAVEDAARRVWARMAEPGPAVIPATAEEVRSIRGCADFQALIPAYLGKSLSPARSLLLEDHVGECLTCRHALRAARPDARAPKARLTSATNRRPILRWAVAAVAVLAVGVGVMVVGPGGFYRAAGAGAVIQSVDGSLYRVSDGGGAALSPGQRINQDEEVRTANASAAVLRLMDGSSIEMSERAALWVTKGWRGATIHLERGKIIVQAAPQHSGRLYVATRDCRVSVKGTIFQVSQGTKGARVSVIQGLVEVEQGRHSQFLHAGDQMSTDASLDRVPVQDEVAWSQNAGQYLALLGELTGLERRLESMPGPGLRYSSKLVNLVPEHAVLYLAIPNIGSALGQANRILQERIQESEVLRQWWEKQQLSGGGAQLSELIPRIETFSDYLGDEVVLAVPVDSSGGLRAPLILAEVKRPDLPQFLDSQFRELNGTTGGPTLRLVKNPSVLPLSPGKQPDTLVLVKDGFLAVTTDVQQLRNAAALIEQSGSGRFAATPFYSAIQQAYQSGAAWLFCVDMEQIVAHSVHQGEGYNVLEDSRTGLGDVKYLVVERKDQGGQTENRATLTFAQERRGIASWLAAPSPMGALDFVSPDASVAASFVVKNPRTLIDEFFSLVQSGDPGFGQGLADFESKSGVSVEEDLAAPLGGEVTFALDGPILPQPSWKVALEVDDPGRLESTIETMVDSFNRQAAAGGGRLELVRAEVSGRTFYTLRGYNPSPAGGSPPAKPFEVDYVYVDGYLVAAPNQDLLRRAIQNRETGYSLSRSADFRARLPRDSYANFSAMVYHNLGAVLGPIIDRLKSSSALTPAQQQSIQALTENNAPSVVCVYGEPNRIVAASTGGVFGLDALAGIGGLAQLPQLMGLATEQAQKGQQQKP